MRKGKERATHLTGVFGKWSSMEETGDCPFRREREINEKRKAHRRRQGGGAAARGRSAEAAPPRIFHPSPSLALVSLWPETEFVGHGAAQQRETPRSLERDEGVGPSVAPPHHPFVHTPPHPNLCTPRRWREEVTARPTRSWAARPLWASRDRIVGPMVQPVGRMVGEMGEEEIGGAKGGEEMSRHTSPRRSPSFSFSSFGRWPRRLPLSAVGLPGALSTGRPCRLDRLGEPVGLMGEEIGGAKGGGTPL